MNIKGDASPYVSVVLCTYNRVELLDGALRTLCHQLGTDDRHEVIVVDNNSADESIARMKEAGVTFIDVDRKPFIDSMNRFYDEMAKSGELPEGFLEAVEATRGSS